MEIPCEERLEEFRTVGDPPADRVAAEFRSRPEAPRDPVGALEWLAQRGFPPAEELWDQVRTTPRWVDFNAMEPAFSVAFQNVFPSGLSLLAGSLVESYASWRGAKVLVRTGRLQDDTERRLFETAKFASDLALYRGARVGNQAWRNVVAVRLMHARVRVALRDTPGWRTDEWGLPVNQEDYAGTLLMFSLVYRRGLERLGVHLSEAEKDGSHANWRHVGWLMGVHPELLTENRAEEVALYECVRRRQFEPDDDSRTLAHGLVRAMAGRPPFFVPLHGLYELSRRLVGDDVADALEFPRSRIWRNLWRGGKGLAALNSRVARARPASRLAVRIGERLTRGIVAMGLPGGTRFD